MKRIEKRLPGVWTPWAEALCCKCHDGIAANPHKRKIEWNTEKDEDEGPGFCTKCGTKIWVHEDIAQLTRIRALIGGDMQQTGGMCSALTLARPDGGTVVVTNLDFPVDIGVYAPGKWDEGEENYQLYRVPRATPDKTIAAIITLAINEERN